MAKKKETEPQTTRDPGDPLFRLERLYGPGANHLVDGVNVIFDELNNEILSRGVICLTETAEFVRKWKPAKGRR